MSGTEPETDRVSRLPLLAAGVLAAVVVIVIALSWIVRDDHDYGPSSADGPAAEASPSAGAGSPTAAPTLEMPAAQQVRCLPATAELLRRAEVAFDGDVESVDGDRVRLAVRRWYHGGDADEVTVVQRELPGTLGSWFTFREGDRYLVSAANDAVLVCGFSGPWAPRTERMFQEAFGS